LSDIWKNIVKLLRINAFVLTVTYNAVWLCYVIILGVLFYVKSKNWGKSPQNKTGIMK